MQIDKLLDSALSYCLLGWSVIPIGFKKKPPIRWKKYQAIRAEKNQIRDWFQKNKNSGIAVILGPISGNLVCRDFDIPESYHMWAEKYPHLAETLPTVKTYRGFHVYGIGPEIYKEFDDGEFRGTSRQYCALPPSKHETGIIYEWLVPLNNSPPPKLPSKHGLLECYTGNPDNPGNPDSTGSPGKHKATQKSQLDPEIEDLIQRFVPTGFGKRHQMIFKLVRKLKGVPQFECAVPNELRFIIKRWHELALPYIQTKDFEESYIDFLRAWEKVKFPEGKGPLDEIRKRALKRKPPEVAYQFDSEGVRLLITICAELQKTAGENPFFLSCRKAGHLLGVDHMTAWRWLYLLQEVKIIYCVSKGCRLNNKASEYKYIAAL